MPDRVIRQSILTSDAVNSLSWPAEIFYRRLMSIVDDYGRYDGRPDILRGDLYALKLDNVSKSDVVKWIAECVEAGLVRLYSTDGRAYLEILKFRQRLRIKKSKFPLPTVNGQSHDSSPPTHDNKVRPVLEKESVFESVSESETESETKGEKKVFIQENFLLPTLLAEWKKHFPRYPEVKENDFPALREIAELIAEKQNIDCDIGVVPFFGTLAEYISKHNWFRTYSLKQVNKHIQSIINSINNDATKHTNGSTKSFREQVNQAFAERYPRGS